MSFHPVIPLLGFSVLQPKSAPVQNVWLLTAVVKMATDWKTSKCSLKGASSVNTDTSQGTTLPQSKIRTLFLPYYETKSKLNWGKKHTAARNRVCCVYFKSTCVLEGVLKGTCCQERARSHSCPWRAVTALLWSFGEGKAPACHPKGQLQQTLRRWGGGLRAGSLKPHGGSVIKC